MNFDLEEEDKGVWFDYPGGGRIQIKLPSGKEVMRIVKKTTEYKPFVYEVPGKPPQVLNQEIPDVERQIQLFNETYIMAWENFFDKNEKPIPCTSEYKTKLMELKDPTFRDFVNEKVKILREAETAKNEAEIKNS